MMLTRPLLQQKISLLEASVADETSEFALYAARELLNYMDRVETLERAIATTIKLPFCNTRPVCEIEAGYAAGVSDCREAIRRAGYPIAGDD